MQRKHWTAEDIKYLKDNIGHKPIKNIAKDLGVTEIAVRRKTYKLGIILKNINGEYWTAEEDRILKENFMYAPKNMLMDMIPNRTWPAIYQRGNKKMQILRLSQDKISVNYKFFENWTQESAYIFGFILADGHLFKNKGERNANSLQIELALYDIDILKKIKKAMEYQGNISISSRKTCRLEIGNVKIIEDLIDKGIPSKNKTALSDFPKTLPKELYPYFILGVFDGDGSIYEDEKSLTFQILGTKSLLEKIKDVIPVDLKNISIYDRMNCSTPVSVCCLKVKGKKAEEIFKWLYKDSSIFLDRKHNFYVKWLNKHILRCSGNAARTQP